MADLDLNAAATHVTSIYTKAQFESFKKRLTLAIMQDALDAPTIANNSAYKEYISNYVQKEVFDKATELAMMERIVRKLAHMSIDTPLGGQREYPVINEYRGHDLINTYYFGLDKDKNVKAKCVPMLITPIIIP